MTELEEFKQDEEQEYLFFIDTFNEYIASIILVIKTDISKTEKKTMINKLYKKYSSKIWEQSEIAIDNIMKKQYKDISKKLKVSIEKPVPIKEVTLIAEDLKILLQGKANEIRLKGFNGVNAYEKISIKKKQWMDVRNLKIWKTNFNFSDKRWRKWNINNYLKLVVWDSMYTALNVTKTSVMIKNKKFKAVWISVLDDRTSEYCSDMDWREIDIRKELLPPAHPRCRSRIEPLI